MDIAYSIWLTIAVVGIVAFVLLRILMFNDDYKKNKPVAEFVQKTLTFVVWVLLLFATYSIVMVLVIIWT